MCTKIKKFCRPSMPKDGLFSGKKGNNKFMRGVKITCTIILLTLIAWFMPSLKYEMYKYREMHIDDLNLDAAKRISSLDFVSENVKEKHMELSEKMKLHCKDDVLFAFQFSENENNITVEDHVFMLCSIQKIIANAEIIKHSDKYILCTEQYADVKKKVKRPSNVIIKAIDIDQWDIVQYQSKNAKEACIIQHAIDILNSKWV